MTGLTLAFVALGLSVDAFAVAVGASIALAGVSARQVFRLAFHFGLFQALMPVFGWLAGRGIGQYLHGWDHWLAFALLVFVGGKAVYAASGTTEERTASADPTRGGSLVMLSVATSIDALAVGLSLALVDVSIWYAAFIIGCVAAALTTCGMLLGGRLGAKFGRRAEVVGGLILIAIGVKILVEHLGAGSSAVV